MTKLGEAVAAWIADDVDESCQAELRELMARATTDAAARGELADRFRTRLQFGTAGLRGVMAAGPNRMNRAVVIQAAKGLIDFLSHRVERPRVVIGNDARYHSREFALDTAAVITAAGGEALLLPDRVPTPLTAYAVRHLGADAGVMVTASHNPAHDNGYKVYLGGRLVTDPERGVQIVPPYDAGIAALIATAGPANQVPRATGWTDCGDEVMESYLAAIAAGPRPAGPIRIVHTAMHGVGSAPARAALARAGFDDVISVAAQQDPDPDFPTVAFPNPEEPGAIDRAVALAVEVAADVVIANDPDADRCAVAVNDPRQGWRMLHGDELGAILGEHVAQAGGDGVLVNSVVSSRQLERIAADYGRPYVTTLTGFKWMGRVPGMAFAYEEAIGYCVRPDLVHDKDGLSTAVAVARLTARLKSEGQGIMDLLDELARRHGLYLSAQLAARFTDLAQIPRVMAGLHAHPLTTLAGAAVTGVVDLTTGWHGLPPTDGVLLTTDRGDRVVVRPSGTEPKVKCYLEVREPVGTAASFEDLTQARAAAGTRLAAIKTDLNAALFG
ncbi:MAG: phospho-sugar mutase [Propionibacteriaceae bacterium]|jgi:phosphomannomutase|nr:phospho-sugar mutase [Propionibacteriaceae bacterium]